MVGERRLESGRSWLSMARAGDRSAFEELLRPLVEPAFRLAVSMLADWHEAEDAVQEASFQAWRKIGQVRGEADAVRPWFLAIVANQCRRRRRLRWFRDVKSDNLESPHPEISEDQFAEAADLRAGLRRLPPDDRAVLLLYYGLDLPLEEVAVALGVRPAGAKSRLYRALGKLRPHLDPDEVSRP